MGCKTDMTEWKRWKIEDEKERETRVVYEDGRKRMLGDVDRRCRLMIGSTGKRVRVR